MAYALKVHDNPNGTVVAACDRELIGETFEEDAVTLTIDESFYAGEDADIDRIKHELHRATTTNFVGETLITALVADGIVDESEIHYVDGVPHVQLFFI